MVCLNAIFRAYFAYRLAKAYLFIKLTIRAYMRPGYTNNKSLGKRWNTILTMEWKLYYKQLNKGMAFQIAPVYLTDLGNRSAPIGLCELRKNGQEITCKNRQQCCLSSSVQQVAWGITKTIMTVCHLISYSIYWRPVVRSSIADGKCNR